MTINNEPAAAGAHQAIAEKQPVAVAGGLARLNTLEEILPSVDALNRFARSRLCECGNLRKLIYDYKRQMLQRLPFEHRLVTMHGVPCHT